MLQHFCGGGASRVPLEAKGNPWLLLMGGWETPSTSLGSQPVGEEVLHQDGECSGVKG